MPVILTQGLLTPLMTAIAQIFKGTVAYQDKKFQETNSVETIKKTGWPQSVRMPNLRRSTKLSEIKRGCNENWLVRLVWTNQA